MIFNRDFASGLVLLALAGTYHLATREIPRSSLSDEVGPDGLPNLLTALLALLGALIAIRGLITRSRAVRTNEQQAAPLRALGFLAIGAGYVLVAPLVGYAIAVALLIAAVALYEGMAPSWRVPAVAVGGGVLFWLIFVALLRVDQPTSLFWG